MKRVAMFSPLPPCHSGIADYTAELLPLLAEQFEIDLYVDDYEPNPLDVGGRVAVRNWRLFENALSREGYDAIVYQMGNSPEHGYMVPFALRYPGVLVLHELVLHHLLFGLTAADGRWELYLRSMLDAHGRSGVETAGRTALDGEAPAFFEYPLSAGVIRRSSAVVVHSQFMRNAVRKIAPELPTHVVPLHAEFDAPGAIADSSSAVSQRRQLGLREDEYLIGCFGFATPHKRLDVVLRVVRRMVESIPRIRLLIVGEVSSAYNLQAIVDELGLAEHLTITGRTSLADFQRYLKVVDVAVALRYPTAGETSASLVRMLAAGKATVTTRIGWFAELPEVVCPKVDLDEFEENTLFALLRLLHGRPDLRLRLGANAQAYAQRHHSVSGTARAYQQVLAEGPAFSGQVNDDELTRAFWRLCVDRLDCRGEIHANGTGLHSALHNSSIPATFMRQVANALVGANLVPQPGSAFERTLGQAMLSLTAEY